MGASLAAVILIATTVMAAPAEEPDAATDPSVEAGALQKRARRAMRVLDFEEAIPLLQNALQLDSTPGPARAGRLADLGLCHANLGETESARAAFEAALQDDPMLELPASAPPKIRDLFDAVRARLSAAAQRSAAEARDQAATPMVELQRPAHEERSRSKVAPMVLGGVSLAALAAGVATALASSSAADELASNVHGRAEVESLMSRQRSMAWVSVGSYSLAAATAVTGAALLFWPIESVDDAGDPGASVSRSPGALFAFHF